MDKELILECATSLGWSQSWQCNEVKVTRAATIGFLGSEDLGEWWISEARIMAIFRVTDDELKAFNRNKKIESLI